jgi:hypothetical protein
MGNLVEEGSCMNVFTCSIVEFPTLGRDQHHAFFLFLFWIVFGHTAGYILDRICLGEGNIGTLDQEADYDVQSLSSSCSETTTATTTMRTMRTAEAAALGSSAAAYDPLLQLGCNCSGGLSLAHRSCIKKWFTQPSLTRNVALADGQHQLLCELCSWVLKFGSRDLAESYTFSTIYKKDWQ